MVPFGGSSAFFVRRMPRRPRARVPVALKISLRSADRSCVSIFIWLSFSSFRCCNDKDRIRPVAGSIGLWSDILLGARLLQYQVRTNHFMDAIPTYARGAGYRHRLGQAHSRVITAVFAFLEIALVGLVIASLIAIAIASQVASSLPVSRFNASPNPHASGMI